VAKFNGGLICVKKAKHLAPRLMRMACPAIVMLDWREVKPFAEIMSFIPASKHPMAVAIQCSNRASKDRACRWTERQATFEFPVFVCSDPNDLEAWLVNTVLRTPALSSLLCILPEVSPTRETKASATVHGLSNSFNASAGQDPIVGVSSASASEKKAIFASDMALQATLSDTNDMHPLHSWQWLQAFLRGVLMGHYRDEELARLLRAAMPSHYEE